MNKCVNIVEDFRCLPRRAAEDVSGICRSGVTKADGEKTDNIGIIIDLQSHNVHSVERDQP